MNHEQTDIFYQAASIWSELTGYRYEFIYGYKNKLYPINLTFSEEDFPHLAGFQYLKDISLPRYNSGKILSRILDRTIKLEHIQKSMRFKDMVLPRLEALARMKDTLDNDFNLFSYMPRMYPFYTQIKADYLITRHSDLISFVFIIHSSAGKTAACDFLCCSAFKQTDRNYEINQRSRTLLKKERIHIASNSSTVLLDRLTPKTTHSETNTDES